MKIPKWIKRLTTKQEPEVITSPEPTRLNTIYSNDAPESIERLNGWLDGVMDKHHGDQMGYYDEF